MADVHQVITKCDGFTKVYYGRWPMFNQYGFVCYPLAYLVFILLCQLVLLCTSSSICKYILFVTYFIFICDTLGDLLGYSWAFFCFLVLV